MGGGGGGHTTATTTSYQSNLPEYAEPYYRSMMERAEDVSQYPYIPYPGQRINERASDMIGGQQMTRDLATSGTPVLNQGANYANQAGASAMGMADRPTHYIGDTPAVAPSGQDWATRFNQDQRDYYMSPYIQGVLDRTKSRAISDYAEQQGLRESEAIRAGAFGGSRRFVEQSIGDRGLMDRLADIDARGLQSAYENAQQQFERDRTARQGATRFNVETAMRGDLANQQAYLTQEQANQRASQFAGELGLRGYQTGLEAGNTLAGMQQAGDSITLDRIRALMGSAGDQESYRQRQLDLAYNDFVNQRDVERQNLQFLNSILRGVPIKANQDVEQVVTQGSNPMANVGAIGGLMSLMGT